VRGEIETPVVEKLRGFAFLFPLEALQQVFDVPRLKNRILGD
jgi:hypothetical protein